MRLEHMVFARPCQLGSMAKMSGPPHGPGHYLKSTRGLYSRASRKVMSILSDYADKFEQASIDEAYLDVTEYCDGDWDKSLLWPLNYKQRYRESWLIDIIWNWTNSNTGKNG